MLESRFHELNLDVIFKHKIICFTGYDNSKSLILDDFKINNNIEKSFLYNFELNKDCVVMDLTSSNYNLKEILNKFKKKKKVIFSINYSDDDLAILLRNEIPIIFTSTSGEEIEAIDLVKHYDNKYVALKEKRNPQENRLKNKTLKYYKFLNYKGDLILPLSFSPWIFDNPKSLSCLLYPKGYNKKKLKRMIYEKTFKNTINHQYLNFVYLCSLFNINYDKVVNAVEKDLIDDSIFKYNISKVVNILENFKDDVILKLLSEKNKMNSLIHLKINKDLIKKSKSWNDILIKTKRYNEYLKNGILNLEQPLKRLDNMYIPKTNIDLFNIGVKFNNCLMKDFNYLEKILNKDIMFFEYKKHCVSINYKFDILCVENINKENLIKEELKSLVLLLKTQ